LYRFERGRCFGNGCVSATPPGSSPDFHFLDLCPELLIKLFAAECGQSVGFSERIDLGFCQIGVVVCWDLNRHPSSILLAAATLEHLLGTAVWRSGLSWTRKNEMAKADNCETVTIIGHVERSEKTLKSKS
jgi:hypothetical protein